MFHILIEMPFIHRVLEIDAVFILFAKRIYTAQLRTEIMGGHDAGTHHQFTGIAKYFNSYTITGRRNCVLATYASIAALILFFKLKPKKQKAVKSS
uniref:ATP synthase membrane subunit k n=1 Tax=Cyprinus carpio carpio TaxID=630221 RepID=A0A8C1E0N8_CYPCA